MAEIGCRPSGWIMPYALRSKMEAELDHLENKPVQFSDRAVPIVPVVKKNRFIRIC